MLRGFILEALWNQSQQPARLRALSGVWRVRNPGSVKILGRQVKRSCEYEMPRDTNSSEPIGAEAGPFGAEFQAAVRAELEAMLVTPIFVQSGRCKRFLNYIVEQTLSGHASHLKERTIGINVFERANDYDTGDDSIVRVTANEVRKRIGQFYQESPQPHLVQIDLPRGSYVPEFRIQPSRQVGIPPSQQVEKPAVSADAVEPEPVLGADAIDLHPNAATIAIPSTGQEPFVAVSKPGRQALRRLMLYPILFVLIAASFAAFWIWKGKEANTRPDLWAAFVHAKVPVLVCIDTHNLQPLALDKSPDRDRFVNLVLRRQIISLDDAAILSSMASELGKKGIAFRVVGAELTSLEDLRRQPVILIGAIDNRWTLRLTQNLRYRIEVANPPGSGSAKEPIASIIDSQNPASRAWVTDLSVPFTQWKSDYAILVRMDDPTTGVPVLIEAGLGNDGTVAASELLNSSAMENILAGDASCKGKANFEAVVGTEIIDMKSGPAHVLRLNCW